MGLLYVGQAATYFTSLKTVPAAVTSILLYLYPAVVMILAAVLLGEQLNRVRVGALVLAVVGVFTVVNPLSAHGTIDTAGLLFGLATAAIYATYILVGRVLLAGVSPVVATAVIATTAGVVLAASATAGGQWRPLDRGRLGSGALDGGGGHRDPRHHVPRRARPRRGHPRRDHQHARAGDHCRPCRAAAR